MIGVAHVGQDFAFVRKTKGQIRIHSENLDKTSVSKPKKIFYSTYPDLKDLEVVLKELRQRKNQRATQYNRQDGCDYKGLDLRGKGDGLTSEG